MIEALLDPALWVGLAAGIAILHSVQRLRARFRPAHAPTVADPPRGIDYADVRHGFYEQGPPTNTPLQSAVALSALDCERERFYHDRFDLLPPDAPQAERFLARFALQHRIATAPEWSAHVRWLRQGGYRREFALLRELVTRLIGQYAATGPTHDPDALDHWLSELAATYGPLQPLRTQQFHRLLNQPESRQLDLGPAYDIGKLVLYYRAGVRLGYMDRAQAEACIDELGGVAAAYYTDWQHFERDLLEMTTFVESNSADAQAAAHRLHAQADGPWQVLPWPCS
jgi:hypothetical protein